MKILEKVKSIIIGVLGSIIIAITLMAIMYFLVNSIDDIGYKIASILTESSETEEKVTAIDNEDSIMIDETEKKESELEKEDIEIYTQQNVVATESQPAPVQITEDVESTENITIFEDGYNGDNITVY